MTALPNKCYSGCHEATEEEEVEENLFAKKAGCQKGLQPINAGYRKHKHYMLNNRSASATEEEDDRATPGKEIWRGKCGQQASGLAGGRWRRQHKTER